MPCTIRVILACKEEKLTWFRWGVPGLGRNEQLEFIFGGLWMKGNGRNSLYIRTISGVYLSSGNWFDLSIPVWVTQRRQILLVQHILPGHGVYRCDNSGSRTVLLAKSYRWHTENNFAAGPGSGISRCRSTDRRLEYGPAEFHFYPFWGHNFRNGHIGTIHVVRRHMIIRSAA